MMGFDQRDIRKTMDVYTRDNVYLGTVLHVVPGSVVQPEQIHRAVQQHSSVNGELRGPMPTAPLGNTGPQRQGAAAHYATASDGAHPLGGGMIHVGRWWGLIARRTIPLAAVQTVSLERVVLKLRQDQL
jgi:hypothetical protein